MGRDVYADIQILYGVTLYPPKDTSWWYVIRRLKEIATTTETLSKIAARVVPNATASTVVASSEKDDGTEQQDKEKPATAVQTIDDVVPEPIAKFVKIYKSILITKKDIEGDDELKEMKKNKDFNEDEYDEDYDDEHYICNNEYEFDQASEQALCKILGMEKEDHGLIMTVKVGRSEGYDVSDPVAILIYFEKSNSNWSTSAWDGVGITHIPSMLEEFNVEQKKKIDDNIAKVVQAFGLEDYLSNKTPDWTLVTTCNDI